MINPKKKKAGVRVRMWARGRARRKECGSGRLHQHAVQIRRLEDDDDNERLGRNHRTDVRGPTPYGHERGRHDLAAKTSKHRRVAGLMSPKNTDSQR